MKMPKAGSAAVGLFESIVPPDPSVEVRKMFGQPAAFSRGHLFMGVFGDEVFLRLGLEDRAMAGELPGVKPFAPMGGHVMKEYLVFPGAFLRDASNSRAWVRKALASVAALQAKSGSAGRRRK
ncbi:MAG TPA: TfoX/Sxy family protein [Thermoplasmata archaeon]|nr:TfoX/Sxy family protein [Thermoplasmata archaeon]